MSRYRGRHRKPSHAGRNLAAVTASGAFAIPLVATGTAPDASAAPDSVWDRLAGCESSGNWAANTGNGFFGGLQFVPSTWKAFGGTRYASSAHLASRAEQIDIAENVLAGQGWGAWPACSSELGLRGNAAEPGKRATPTRAAPTPKAQKRNAPQAAPNRKAKATPQGKATRLAGRAADGSGRYVCDTARLHFEACDPGNLGQTVAYPLYDGRAPARRAQSAPTANPVSAGSSRIADAALRYRGVPYLWGGETRTGMDCSGLVWTVLRELGHNPPRTALAQSRWATPITAAQARPGDLVFHYSPVSHVGIYLGGGRMVDASRPGTVVSVHAVYTNPRYGRVPS